nr:protein-glucosylgalactosylhydroxylysine glucosidase-like [Lytechinus pictus]
MTALDDSSHLPEASGDTMTRNEKRYHFQRSITIGVIVFDEIICNIFPEVFNVCCGIRGLPEDDCCKASIGNGYLATTVYTDTIYKNGLYNGRNGESDRARIPSTIAIKIQQSQPEIKNSYLLDVLNGTFFHLIETPQAYIEQRLYAHQVLTRLLVNEITIKRKFVSMEQPMFLTLSNNLGFKSEDIEFSIAPPSSEQGPWY